MPSTFVNTCRARTQQQRHTSLTVSPFRCFPYICSLSAQAGGMLEGDGSGRE